MFQDKEKVFTYLIIFTVVVALLIVILTIWIPSSTVKDLTIRNYEEKNYAQSRIEYYQQNAYNILGVSNFEKTYSKIDNNYLVENNLTDAQSAKDYLMTNSFIGSSIVVESVDLLSKNDNNYLYRITYNISEKRKYAFISEKKINDYTITFSSTGTLNNLEASTTKNYGDFEFIVNTKESRLDSIVFEITVKNNSKDIRADFDFADIYSVQATLEDNSVYNLSTLVSTGDNKFNLNPNSYFTKEYVFSIPQDLQGKISLITFNDIHFTSGWADVEIPLN